MNRFIKVLPVYTVSFGLLLALVGHSAQAQDTEEEIIITSTHVAGNIYMLQGYGGNIGASIGEDGIVLIDDQFAKVAEKITTALDSLGGGKLRFVLNTHWHGDHTGGNEIFGKTATIVAHENVRKRLTVEQKQFERVIPAKAKEGWPVITFSSSLSIHFNGEEIEVIHFPHGHTDGDAVIFFPESNVIHTGDIMFSGMFPFVDLDHGGDVALLTVDVEKLIEMAPEGVKIIPGHGPLSTIDELKLYLTMLKETSATIQAGIDSGKTIEEIQAAGLDEKWSSWNWSFITTEKWIATVHRSLTQ